MSDEDTIPRPINMRENKRRIEIDTYRQTIRVGETSLSVDLLYLYAYAHEKAFYQIYKREDGTVTIKTWENFDALMEDLGPEIESECP